MKRRQGNRQNSATSNENPGALMLRQGWEMTNESDKVIRGFVVQLSTRGKQEN